MSKQSFKLIYTSTLVAVFLLMVSSCADSNVETVNANQTTENPTVTPLNKALTEGAFLVDVRTPTEFEAGSVKGAVNIPLDEVESKLEQFKDKENIVVFCRSGGRSAQAMKILNQNGFNNVVNGMTWQNVNSNLKKVDK